MQKLIPVLILATSLSACAPHPKPPAQQTFSVCVVGGKHFANEALVTLKGEDEENLYDFDIDPNSQYKFHPHAGTDEGMPKTHHAFMAVSPFDPRKIDWRGENCQSIVGKIID